MYSVWPDWIVAAAAAGIVAEPPTPEPTTLPHPLVHEGPPLPCVVWPVIVMAFLLLVTAVMITFPLLVISREDCPAITALAASVKVAPRDASIEPCRVSSISPCT